MYTAPSVEEERENLGLSPRQEEEETERRPDGGRDWRTRGRIFDPEKRRRRKRKRGGGIFRERERERERESVRTYVSRGKRGGEGGRREAAAFFPEALSLPPFLAVFFFVAVVFSPAPRGGERGRKDR